MTPDVQDDAPPLWKQILGAVMGGGLALALYYGYEYAKPHVTAYLTLPPVEGGRTYDLGAANIADKTMDETDRKRIVSRNLRAAGTMDSETMGTPAGVDSVEDHSLDIAWPGEPVEATVAATEPVTDPTPAAETGAVEEADATMALEDEEDSWDSLWKDIEEEDSTVAKAETVRSEAPALPDSGFGPGIAVAGAALGTAYSRMRRHKTEPKPEETL